MEHCTVSNQTDKIDGMKFEKREESPGKIKVIAQEFAEPGRRQ